MSRHDRLRPILDVAADLDLRADDARIRGDHVVKVHLGAVHARPRRGKLVLVTATTPTPHGEGKTVTAIGLADALRQLGVRSAVTLRQPSLGPLLGAKGGATGGGRATVEPAEDINLHFTGDAHAVATAQNLIAAMAAASLHHGNPRGIDPTRLALRRCIDVEDRELRRVLAGFVLTEASETMAILSLARDHADLKARVGRVVVAFTREGKPVTAGDVGAAGAVGVLLRDAHMPNLVQTAEGTPALVHGGPFANVSHGHSSFVADALATSRADVVVTESGFASELGVEKYVDLVAPQTGLQPDAAVLVTSARALAMHGLENLDAHLAILERFGLPAVVAVNRFPDDAEADVSRILRHCADRGAPAGVSTVFRDGGKGGVETARLLQETLRRREARVRPLYDASATFEDKLDAIARRVYGADGATLEPPAREAIQHLRAQGYGSLPVCVAKTPLSLSDDPVRAGVPRNWRLAIQDVGLHAGAGYLVALARNVFPMPGLGPAPAALRFDVDEQGGIVGLG